MAYKDRNKAKAWRKDNITPERQHNYYETFKEKNKDASRRYFLKKWYDLTPDQYDQLLQQQEGKCAICRGDNRGKRLLVDHSHITKQIRGLLCYSCNNMLGMMKDDPDMLIKASEYVKAHYRKVYKALS